MVNSMGEKRPDMLCCGLTEETKEGKENLIANKLENGIYDKTKIEQIVIPNYFSYNGGTSFGIESYLTCKLIRTSILKRQKEFINDHVTIGEDVIASILCMLISEQIQIDNDITGCYYRYVSESMTKKYDRECLTKIRNLFMNLDVIRNKYGNQYVLEQPMNIYKMYMLVNYGMAHESCKNVVCYLYRLKRYFGRLIHDEYLHCLFEGEIKAFSGFEVKKRILIGYLRDNHLYKALLLCCAPKKIVEVLHEKV